MTHDELLAKIDEPNPIMVHETQAQMELLKQKEIYLLSTFQSLGINPEVLVEQNALITQLKAQIRAVVELHQPYLPEPKIYPNWITCKGCAKWQDDWADYPCPTIQAIEQELP
jgi:hypothetical protein